MAARHRTACDTSGLRGPGRRRIALSSPFRAMSDTNSTVLDARQDSANVRPLV
jgi:hypothetical protein